MKGALRKEHILEHAKKIFSTKGYYEAHIEDILKSAKIGKGTFYIYYKNKEDLFTSLLEKYLDEWENAVIREMSGMQSDDIMGYFHIMIRRSLLFFNEHEDLCNIYFRIGPGINDTFESFFERFEQRMLGYIKSELERGIQRGRLRNDIDINLATNIVAGAFLRVAYYYNVYLKRKNEPVDIDLITDQFNDAIIKGMQTPGA